MSKHEISPNVITNVITVYWNFFNLTLFIDVKYDKFHASKVLNHGMFVAFVHCYAGTPALCWDNCYYFSSSCPTMQHKSGVTLYRKKSKYYYYHPCMFWSCLSHQGQSKISTSLQILCRTYFLQAGGLHSTECIFLTLCKSFTELLSTWWVNIWVNA